VSGSHAEKIVLPVRAVLPVPDGVSDESAALLPFLAGVYSAIARSDLPMWANILVVGDGGIGLLAALAFAAAGYTVTVRGKHGNRFDLCRRHSIHFNLVTDEPEVRGHRPGRFGPALISYPFVIEASGHSSGWDAALALVNPGGTVFVLSSCNDGVPRPLAGVQEKNVRVMGLREGPLESALAIVSDGLFDPSEVITSVFPLEHAAEAYAKARASQEWIPLLRMQD
jgi:L-iditol 2-dehydrogenase